MYAAFRDPYCYIGTAVLRNRLGLRDPSALDAFEAEASAARARQTLPAGRLSPSQYRAIHRQLFQDVYAWAGRYRTVRISKGASTFCYPEHIGSEMSRLFATLRPLRQWRALPVGAFAERTARFLAELNAIHPFREGNGRAQLSFFVVLATHAGHDPDLDRVAPAAVLSAMIGSFGGDERPLARLLGNMVGR